MLVKQLGGLKLCYKCYRRRKGSHEDGVKDAAMTQGTQTGEAEGDNNTPGMYVLCRHAYVWSLSVMVSLGTGLSGCYREVGL